MLTITRREEPNWPDDLYECWCDLGPIQCIVHNAEEMVDWLRYAEVPHRQAVRVLALRRGHVLYLEAIEFQAIQVKAQKNGTLTHITP